MLCAQCHARVAPYIESGLCGGCLGLTVLSPEAATAWIASEVAATEQEIQSILQARPAGFDAALATVLEVYGRDEAPEILMFDMRLLTMLDELSAPFQPAPAGTPSSPMIDTATQLMVKARKLGHLRRLRYSLEERKEELVDGAPAELHNDDWQPPPTALTKRNRLWTNWTRIGYNRAGKEISGDPAKALEFTSKKALTLFRFAEKHQIPIGALDLLVSLQHFKEVAPKAHAQLVAAGPQVCTDIAALCDVLVKWAENPSVRSPPGNGLRGAALITPSQLQQRAGAVATHAPRIEAGNSSVIIPLLFPNGANYWYAPSAVFHVARQARGLGYVEGKRADIYAGSAFERYIARVLDDAGFDVEHAGELLTSVMLAQGGQGEIDILAWNATEVLLVEVKAQAEPPGAWSDKNVDSRRKELAGYQQKLAAKVGPWKTRLESAQPWARLKPDEREVKLPPGLLKSRKLRAVIVSARVEPMPDSADPVVVSYLAPTPYKYMARQLADVDLASLWNGLGPPPTS